jgi:hypothetical protein
MSSSGILAGQCGSADGIDLSPSRRAQRPFPGHPVRHRLVLNSVGCVHQEDWLWPPGGVKKRMQCCDVVSSGTRCTTALERTRKFRQDQASELRVVTSELLRHEDRARACDAPRKEANDIRVRGGGHLRAGVDATQPETAELLDKSDSAGFHGRDARIAVQAKGRAEMFGMVTESLDHLRDGELEKLLDDLDAALQRSVRE